MSEMNPGLYDLSTGNPVTSLTHFSSPLDEYCAAFARRDAAFLNYYSTGGSSIQKRTFTRGEFWDLASTAAAYLRDIELIRSDRIIQCFSANSLYDLLFRLAAVMVGCTPVTINWEVDDNDRVAYKTRLTGARLLLYDEGFADRIKEINAALPDVTFFEARLIEGYVPIKHLTPASPGYRDEKMVVFTSGTTGRPKGVSLSHQSYLANRLTFEAYSGVSDETKIDFLLVNPMHHTNSTALTDWGMRREGAVIHLIQRYSTEYWKILVDVASKRRDQLITSLVPRHIDFLESLSSEGKLPVELSKLREVLSQTDILIGSAPVGPTTVNRILKFGDKLPHVRFGSTETCLQVMGTPMTMPQSELLEAFQAGWAHKHDDNESAGYYIGREHYPFTRVRVVKSTDPASSDYFRPCEIGEPGYLVTQGANIMSGYVGDDAATKSVFRKSWYTGLKDIAFALKNKNDGKLDYYWMARDSELLIRGGAKYAYEQIAEELSRVLVRDFALKPAQFKLAVVGIRLGSEHEDTCCVTIELVKEAATSQRQLAASFIETAAKKVSKGARPHYIRFAPVPLSFKGAVLYPQMQQDFLKLLKPKT